MLLYNNLTPASRNSRISAIVRDQAALSFGPRQRPSTRVEAISMRLCAE